MIMGPSLGPGLNVSNKIIADMVNGVYPGILSMTWGIVDVRDVAHAHVRAPKCRRHGRYLLVQEPAVTMRTMVGWLREAGYGDGTKLPSRGMDNGFGNLLVKLNSYVQPPGVGSYLRTHIGRVPRFTASKARTGTRAVLPAHARHRARHRPRSRAPVGIWRAGAADILSAL